MTRVLFKHEGEVDGVPIGPVWVLPDGVPVARPFDPNREPDPWLTIHDATSLAQSLGVPLEET